MAIASLRIIQTDRASVISGLKAVGLTQVLPSCLFRAHVPVTTMAAVGQRRTRAQDPRFLFSAGRWLRHGPMSVRGGTRDLREVGGDVEEPGPGIEDAQRIRSGFASFDGGDQPPTYFVSSRGYG